MVGRADFERWASGLGLDVERVVSDKRYISMETEWAWRAAVAFSEPEESEGDWVMISTRLPTAADATAEGLVRWRRSGVGCHNRYDEVPVDADAWMPIPVTVSMPKGPSSVCRVVSPSGPLPPLHALFKAMKEDE